MGLYYSTSAGQNLLSGVFSFMRTRIKKLKTNNQQRQPPTAKEGTRTKPTYLKASDGASEIISGIWITAKGGLANCMARIS